MQVSMSIIFLVTTKEPGPGVPTKHEGEQEQAFLASYDPAAFPPIAVTVDIVLLTVRNDRLAVLLVRRGAHPFRGCWALPGGFVTPGEDLDEAAVRELTEEAGIPAGTAHLEQLRTYGAPGRDPRMRVVSVAYLALAPDPPLPQAGTDAAEARFHDVAALTDGSAPTAASAPTDASAPTEVAGSPLAFDHRQILTDAVERARAKLENTSVATTFVEEPFTLTDLRRVYEAMWGQPLHPANFRRKVLSAPGFVTPTGQQRATGRGWADLYVRGTPVTLHPALLRPRP